MRRATASTILVVAIAGCSESRSKSPAPEPLSPPVQASAVSAPDIAAAQALLVRFECNRCHEGSGLEPPPFEKQCVGCHEEIIAGTAPVSAELMVKWRENLHSLPVAPSLSALSKKFRQSWVRELLLSPVDVRPALAASMPRFRITRSEATLLAAALVPEEAKPETFPDLAAARGASLFQELACDACHAFGKRSARPRTVSAKLGDPSRGALLLAPDLIHTRERFQSGRLVAWLMDPEAVQPGTLMPNFKLTRDQASSLAAFLWYSEAEALALPPVPERLPPLEREVGWDEVFASVFKTVCWHCHSASDLAYGDGGVGNTGGFGYPAKGFDLSSYEAIRSGSFGPEGKRRSVFTKDESGTPLIIRHMLARRGEVRGENDPKHLGMPLGFPPMSPEQIQLVESWIAQGRPR